MKSRIKLKAMRSIAGIIAMVAMVAVIALSMAACDNGSTGGGAGYNPGGYDSGGGSGGLSGSYYYSSSWYVNFSGNRYTEYMSGYAVQNGTYSVSGNSITFNPRLYGTWTIVNSSTLRDGSGDYWYRR